VANGSAQHGKDHLYRNYLDNSNATVATMTNIMTRHALGIFDRIDQGISRPFSGYYFENFNEMTVESCLLD
jgi:hypothetical protein